MKYDNMMFNGDKYVTFILAYETMTLTFSLFTKKP